VSKNRTATIRPSLISRRIANRGVDKLAVVETSVRSSIKFPGRIVGCNERLWFRSLGKYLRTLIIFRARWIAHSSNTLCRCSFALWRYRHRLYEEPLPLDIRLHWLCFRWRSEPRSETIIAVFGLRRVQLLLLFFAVFVCLS